ncbi:dCTP deaminase [Candidatus Gracilibacteria bacterium]|nr:dCTP deaminase [Candidatus Gracilibacteria bacterium]MCF7819176.1 dCTP deaminase [Candidatus Gracilibacteria bacterium]
MILTRHDIAQLMQEKKLLFEPALDAFQNQPHAVDLRLGMVFYIPKIWKLSPEGREVLNVDVTESAGENFEKLELKPGQFFELAPGESIVASTLEKISLCSSDIMGILYPRSSINRRGLTVDLTGIVDVHYSGHLMIPILNRTSSQVIRVYPGERICQIVFHRLTGEMNPEEARRHGKSNAKYDGCDAQNLSSKKDAEEEISLIRKGDFKSLKKHPY